MTNYINQLLEATLLVSLNWILVCLWAKGSE